FDLALRHLLQDHPGLGQAAPAGVEAPFGDVEDGVAGIALAQPGQLPGGPRQVAFELVVDLKEREARLGAGEPAVRSGLPQLGEAARLVAAREEDGDRLQVAIALGDGLDQVVEQAEPEREVVVARIEVAQPAHVLERPAAVEPGAHPPAPVGREARPERRGAGLEEQAVEIVPVAAEPGLRARQDLLHPRQEVGVERRVLGVDLKPPPRDQGAQERSRGVPRQVLLDRGELDLRRGEVHRVEPVEPGEHPPAKERIVEDGRQPRRAGCRGRRGEESGEEDGGCDGGETACGGHGAKLTPDRSRARRRPARAALRVCLSWDRRRLGGAPFRPKSAAHGAGETPAVPGQAFSSPEAHPPSKAPAAFQCYALRCSPGTTMAPEPATSLDLLDWPAPTDAGVFESLCLDLWEDVWGPGCGAQQNGRSGQEQAGVDVFGQAGGTWAGVQCKARNLQLRSRLSAKELEAEAIAAHAFVPALGEFIVATTGPADVALQERARVLTASGPLRVEFWSWREILRELSRRPDLLRRIAGRYWPTLLHLRGSQKVAPSRLTHVAEELFGRETERPMLDAAWDDPNIHVVTFVAWGGVGKTSLVAKWAAE